MFKNIIYIYIFIIVILLSNCGFHLRGNLSDYNKINFNILLNTRFYIQSKRYFSIVDKLKYTLISYRAIIVNDKRLADYILNIRQITKNFKYIGVVNEGYSNYQLIYTIIYNVIKVNKKISIVPITTINSQTFWQSNPNIQLAKNNELNRVYEYLEYDLTMRIILQIVEFLS